MRTGIERERERSLIFFKMKIMGSTYYLFNYLIINKSLYIDRVTEFVIRVIATPYPPPSPNQEAASMFIFP